MDHAPVGIASTVGGLLSGLLASIEAQSLDVSTEVIVLDDASTDETIQVLERCRHLPMRLIRHAENQGHTRTFHEGLELARGTYVARIDPDDRYRPSFLAATLPAFDQAGEIILVYGDVAQIDETGSVTCERSLVDHDHRAPTDVRLSLLAHNFIAAPATIARREAWLSVEPVPLWAAFNDWYYTSMMACRGLFAYVDEVVADYRVHATNHHTLIARDGTEQMTARWMIESALAQGARVQRGARARILGCHYLESADKGFGAGNFRAARRNYAGAIRSAPDMTYTTPAIRRMAATVLPPAVYARTRGLLAAIVGRS